MTKITAAATIAMIAMAGPAYATVFNYDATIGNGIGDTRISIDSVAGTAKLSGANIDLTLTGQSLIGFDGVNSRKTFKSDSIDGTFTRNGTTYDAFQSTTPKHTLLSLGSNSSFLWTYGTSPTGKKYDFDGKGNLTFVGSSSGGGSVPGPAPLSLIAAMALFGVWRRRRSVAA